MAQNFNLWIGKPRIWRKQDGRVHSGWGYFSGSKYESAYVEGDAPRKVAGPFVEPAEAADVAEDYLRRFGTEGQSWAELRFNGTDEPHSMIFFMENEMFGVWNTASAKWPIYYPEGPYGTMLEGYPEGFSPDEGEGKRDSDDSADGFGDTDEEAEVMDLSNDGSEEDDDSDNVEEDDDAEDEFSEDDEAEDEASTEDDDADDEIEKDGDQEPDEDEINTDDEEDDDSNEPETEDGPDEEDDSSESEDDPDENGDDDDMDSDSEDEDDDSDDEDENDEEEVEMPRLKIFAKMRGPKGWRKRADAEELLDRNVFGFKVGVLNEDGETPGQQEKDVRVHVDFIEADDSRKSGVLRMRFQKGVSLDDFKQTGGGWITVEVPYRTEES